MAVGHHDLVEGEDCKMRLKPRCIVLANFSLLAVCLTTPGDGVAVVGDEFVEREERREEVSAQALAGAAKEGARSQSVRQSVTLVKSLDGESESVLSKILPGRWPNCTHMIT